MRAMMRWKRVLATFLATAATGTAFAGGCTSDQLQLAAAGIDAILNNLQEDEDISFGDWLESEFGD